MATIHWETKTADDGAPLDVIARTTGIHRVDFVS
jgi:hypothetical protein